MQIEIIGTDPEANNYKEILFPPNLFIPVAVENRKILDYFQSRTFLNQFLGINGPNSRSAWNCLQSVLSLTEIEVSFVPLKMFVPDDSEFHFKLESYQQIGRIRQRLIPAHNQTNKCWYKRVIVSEIYNLRNTSDGRTGAQIDNNALFSGTLIRQNIFITTKNSRINGACHPYQRELWVNN